MPKPTAYTTSFIAGISDSEKSGTDFSIAFNRSTDFRTDPKKVTLLPRSEKDSGSLVKGLPMWFERACARTFAYANNGDIYQKENGTWSKVHTSPNSSGNGMSYFGEDRNLYYAQDKTIGRLTEACTGSDFYDGFIESEGGEPTNTRSLDLERDSSEYAFVADNASNSITSDISLEIYTSLESLPDTDEEFVLLSKWNEQSNQRSYKLDITTKTDFFGDGRDGALTISSNTTEDPIDANCSGTQGQTTITTSNEHASFSSIAAGDKVIIIQSRGTGVGQYQLTDVVSYSSNTLTILDPLTFSPLHSATAGDANKAQVRILKQHTDVTVNAGITYTAKAWDGFKGGIIGWYANGTRTINGTVTATGKGFRGGAAVNGSGLTAYQGEGTSGAGTTSHAANGNGGGGGQNETGLDGISSTGGSGGNATSGDNGYSWKNGGSGYTLGFTSVSGVGGSQSGTADLSLMTFGGGGGGGGGIFGDNNGYAGGNGGGIICDFSATIAYGDNGSMTTDGVAGTYFRDGMSGGNGAGGSILMKTQTAVLGTLKTTADRGKLVTNVPTYASFGIINVDYLTSVSGTSTPEYNSNQDSTLGSGDGYLLRLHISDDGTDSEIYSWDITNTLNVSSWRRFQITWEDTTSTATAYINGDSYGSKTSTMTAIYNSTASLAIGCDFDSSGNAQNFYDGLVDDIRVWNDIRTASELLNWNDSVLFGTESNLIAYFEFESDLTDSQTSGNNDLTHSGTATYSTSVPFSGVTTRQDQDQSDGNVAHAGTFTLETAISEAGEDRATFVPDYDPQKSIIIKINTVGTGDWTVTIHDALNREVASKTVTNSELYTGFYEFIWDTEWRPIVGATYHIHVTSTVADGIINVKTGETTIGASADSSPYLYFTTHFGVLVDDDYHPMAQMLNFLAIGNERYLAKLEGGDIYTPNILTLPSGYRIRCLAYWREYLAIGVWQGTSITDFDKGWIFFWDGISETYNHFISVPEGGINAMFGSNEALFIIAGYTGELLVYTGGLTAQKLKRVPRIENNEYIEIAPGAMTMWRTLLTFGTNLLTDSTNVHQGVYTYGTKNENYPYSLGFSYPLSLGDQTSTNVKIGAVYPSGQDLYVGWQNSNAYGIDKISTSNSPYSTGTIEMLIKDLNKLGKISYPLTFRADFEPLNEGESIVIKYKADRESSWETIDTQSTAGKTEARGTISEQVKEYQLAIDLKTTVSTSPKLLGAGLELDLAERERNA